jgi:NADPH-dependent 2,4-dienoyl-CoA reductase/sulfur reductase-like enzyme
MTAPQRVSRRRVLGGGAAALIAAPLLGCASDRAGPPIGRVVVVGGGYGGATAARYLRLWGGTIDVTLVERDASFVSCPMSNLVLAGLAQIGDITRPYSGLEAVGVRRVQADAVAIDAQRKQVRLADGRTLPYDRAIVSPGVDIDAVEGLSSATAQMHVPHAWKAGPQTVALRAQLEAMPDGGVYAITIPPAPYRCPPGPYERACLVAHYFKQSKPRSKVLVLDANPEIQSKKVLFERAFTELYRGIIEYRPNNELRSVDAATRTAKLDFDDLRVDVLNVVPPQRAAAIARQAGLVNINNRWVGVDWQTMESTAVPGIHVLGDATFSAPLMPKSGHIANQHAKVAAAAIIQRLKGEPIEAAPMMVNCCYSFVSADQAIHVASVHRYDAGEKTMKLVTGGLSSKANAAEARIAHAWTQNIWADTLAI